jgi:hypothetical protein
MVEGVLVLLSAMPEIDHWHSLVHHFQSTILFHRIIFRSELHDLFSVVKYVKKSAPAASLVYLISLSDYTGCSRMTIHILNI